MCINCPVSFTLNLSWEISCCKSIFNIYYVQSHVNVVLSKSRGVFSPGTCAKVVENISCHS